MESVTRDPFLEISGAFSERVEQPAVMLGIIIFCALFAIAVGAFALSAL